jgi:Flp pilus assembly protein TadD
MPPELRERFARDVLAERASARERVERIVAFVFDEQGLGMRYDEAATVTVAEAWAGRRANCLGFTLLFVALAREAGLEARPRIVGQALSWDHERGILYRESHINAEVRIGTRTLSLDVARDTVLARGRPVILAPRQLAAQYRNNLAMQALAREDLAEAQRHARAALELDPAYAGHWSNAGVVYLRAGDAAAAEAAYLAALARDPEHTNALFNMVSLALRSGDAAREREYRARLDRVQRRDPFHHFLKGHDHERSGDLPEAIRHYRRAIALHGDDHRFHAALAGALLRSGDTPGARRALKRAVALSDGAPRADYEARLVTLGNGAAPQAARRD